MTNSINNKKIKLRTATLSLIIGILLLLVKFSAYLITDSAAIFSDAAESVINVVAAAVALYSVMLSSKPADKDHPYGHGKIEFISASIEAAMIIGILFIE